MLIVHWGLIAPYLHKCPMVHPAMLSRDPRHGVTLHAVVPVSGVLDVMGGSGELELLARHAVDSDDPCATHDHAMVVSDPIYIY